MKVRAGCSGRVAICRIWFVSLGGTAAVTAAMWHGSDGARRSKPGGGARDAEGFFVGQVCNLPHDGTSALRVVPFPFPDAAAAALLVGVFLRGGRHDDRVQG